MPAPGEVGPPGTAGLLRLGLSGLSGMPGGADGLALFAAPPGEPLRGLLGLVDWRLAGAIGRARAAGLVTGQPGDRLLLPASGRLGRGRIFVFGLGPAAEWGPQRLGEVVPAALAVMRAARVGRPALAVPAAARAPARTEGAFVALCGRLGLPAVYAAAD